MSVCVHMCVEGVGSLWDLMVMGHELLESSMLL